MKSLVEYTLEDGTKAVIEVELPAAGAERAGLGDEIAKATQTFEASLDQARSVAQAVLKRLRSLPEEPDELTVAFGIKLGAKVGAVIASGEAGANFSVTITWHRPATPRSVQP